MWKATLKDTIRRARDVAIKSMEEHPDEIDLSAVLFMDMYLWCSLFYATDNIAGVGKPMTRDQRTEMIFQSAKELIERNRRMKMDSDYAVNTVRIILTFMASFDRLVESSGGIAALCRPMLSLCVRTLSNDRTFDRIFLSPQGERAFDVAAAHAAVFIFNRLAKTNVYRVLEGSAAEMNLTSPDVFVSYASENRGAAVAIADSLNALRVATWIDREIEPTTQFGRAIDAHLSVARIVLVIWSEHSVRSRWVQAEALHGFQVERLVGIMITPCSLPVPFNSVQAISWAAGPEHRDDNWKKLSTVLGERLGRPGLSEYIASQGDAVASASWKLKFPDDPLAAA